MRAILLIDLINTNYDEDEVELIKTKLSGLEKQKLNIYSTAIRATNKILGRLDTKDVRIMNEMILETEEQ